MALRIILSHVSRGLLICKMGRIYHPYLVGLLSGGNGMSLAQCLACGRKAVLFTSLTFALFHPRREDTGPSPHSQFRSRDTVSGNIFTA